MPKWLIIYVAFTQLSKILHHKKINAVHLAQHLCYAEFATFSHPDYTVGPGFTPDPAYATVDVT